MFALAEGQLNVAVQPGHFFFLRISSETLPVLRQAGPIEALVKTNNFPDGPAWLFVEPGDNRTLVVFGTPPDNVAPASIDLVVVSPSFYNFNMNITVDKQASQGE